MILPAAISSLWRPFAVARGFAAASCAGWSPKVERHYPGEQYPQAGFFVTNMNRPAERVVVFYSQRGNYEQWVKESKGAIKLARLSYRSFSANGVHIQLHALAHNLGNISAPLTTPEPIKD